MTLREVGWPTLIALLLALAVAAVAVTASDLTFTFYRFWWLPTLGIILTVFAAWRNHRPWLLLLAPVFLAPLVPLLALLTACAFGNCI